MNILHIHLLWTYLGVVSRFFGLYKQCRHEHFCICFYCICARLCGCVARGETTGSYGMPKFSFAGVGLHCHQQCESISPSTVAESFVGVSWLQCAFPKWLMEFMSYIYVYSLFGYLFF